MGPEKEPNTSDATSAELDETTPPRTDDADLRRETRNNDRLHAEESHKRRHLIVVGVAAVVILLTILAGLVYYFAQPVKLDRSTRSSATNSESSANPAVISPKSVAKPLVEELKGKVTGTISGTNQGVSFAKPTGYEFYVNVAKQYGIKVKGTETQMNANREALRIALKEKGYSETIHQASSGGSAMFEAEYQTEDVKCAVYDIKPYQGNGNYEASVVCADMYEYLAVAKSVKPLADVYAAATTEDITTLAFNNPEIEKSSTPGYQRAVVAISGAQYGAVGGFAGLFYQTPDEVWHYFTGTQNILECTKYSTVHLKKAYLGEACAAADYSQSKVAL